MGLFGAWMTLLKKNIMALKIILKVKCSICRDTMHYKAFVGAGNVQGHECRRCGLIVGNSAFRKLDEVMFSWRLRNKCQLESS